MSPGQAVAAKDWVRLTTLDGDRIEIVDPRVSEGQVVGHPVRGGFSVRSDTVRVHIDSVAYIQTRQIHAGATALAAAVGVTIAAGVACFVAALAALSEW